MGTSTFGFNAQEDRVWMSSSDWSERIWLTRRQSRSLIELLAQALQNTAQGDDKPAQMVREHDASINRPRNVQNGPVLQMGRDAVTAHQAASYVLCTRIVVATSQGGSDNVSVTLGTSQKEWTLHFSREDLHRWLRALHMVIQQGDWQLPDMPDWLVRSYLPHALKAILTSPLPDSLTDDEEDKG